MNAVELLPPLAARPDNPEWHRLRAAGVSASDIAAVLGISPWDSAFSLYHRKVNGWDAEPNDEMSTGTILEPAIANLWAHHCDPHENLELLPAGLYASTDRPWQLATPDRIVTSAACQCGAWAEPDVVCSCMPWDGVLAVLECKWAATWDGWGDDGTDQIPAYYRAQVLQQCDVLGIGQWYLGVLGPSGFRTYTGTVDRTARRDLALMRREGAAFARRLAEFDPPPVDDGHPATTAALKRLHPSVEPGDVETTAEFADGWRRARALRKRAEALCDRYENRARHDLGHYQRLTVDGRLVCSRSVFDQTGDTAELTALETDRPTTNRLNPGRLINA